MVHQKVAAVLGMSRSGTSALAGSPKEAGLHLGPVLDEPIPTNQKSLQKSGALLDVHEDLLRKNGGSWCSPPRRVCWQPLHRAVRYLFIESRAAHPAWGFKHPARCSRSTAGSRCCRISGVSTFSVVRRKSPSHFSTATN